MVMGALVGIEISELLSSVLYVYENLDIFHSDISSSPLSCVAVTPMLTCCAELCL